MQDHIDSLHMILHCLYLRIRNKKMEQLIHISVHDDYYVSHSSVVVKDMSENIFHYFDQRVFDETVIQFNEFIRVLSDTLETVSCTNNWETKTQRRNIVKHIACELDIEHITNIESYLNEVIENLLPPQNIVSIDSISIYNFSEVKHALAL